MKRRKTVQPNKTLAEFIQQYDPEQLKGIVRTMDTNVGWEILRAYIKLRQREFEVAALDLIRADNMTHGAAHASGYAQACGDMSETFIQELYDLVAGRNLAVENPPPQEVEL